MKTLILSSFLVVSLIALSACHIGKGYPGEAPDINRCNPGHELAKDCPTEVRLKP